MRTDKETAEMIMAFSRSNFDPISGSFKAPLIIYPSNDSRKEPVNAGMRRRPPDLTVEVRECRERTALNVDLFSA